MASQLAQVRPGDLIRADDYNLLIARVNDLGVRVERLEAGAGGGDGGVPGAPVIETLTPPSPRIGDTVVITGSRFDYATGAARVTIDGIFVTLLAGSSDTTLIFQVPQLAGIPDGGRPVELAVHNVRLSTIRSVIVLPEIPPLQGNVNIQFEDTLPARITLNQPCTFHFKLVSEANVPVTLTLAPTTSVPAWNAGLQILDDAGSLAPSGQVTVGALREKDFFVRVAQITSAATNFTMTVNGQGQGIVTSSGAQAFTVGEIGAQDTEIRLSIEGVIRGTPDGDPLSGTTVTLMTNERGELDLLGKFHRIGTYTWTARLEPQNAGWALDTSALPASIVVQQGDIHTSGPDVGWAVDSLPVVVTAPSSARTADLVFTLQRQQATLRRSLTLRLIATA
jgi:hypothetical protein